MRLDRDPPDNVTISAKTDSQAQVTRPHDAAVMPACGNWMVATIPANDRWQHDRWQELAPAGQSSPASNIVAFKPRADEGAHIRQHAASASAPVLPERVGEDDRLAPPLAPRARHSLTAPLLIAASLLCHALALAYFADHVPSAIAIGEKPVLAELVTGISAASGISGEAFVDSIASDGARADHNPPRIAPEPQSLPPDDMIAPASQAHEPPAQKTALTDPADESTKPVPRRPEPRMSASAKDPRKDPRNVAREKRESTRHAALASPASVQASQAASQSASASATNYAGQVARHLQRFKRNTAEARARGASGTASVSFRVNGAGSAHAIRLVRSSGHASLDAEALALVQRASPFPPPPNGQGGLFTVPVYLRVL